MNLADEFPLDPGTIYLNHAAVAPWPRRSAEAVMAFARENMRQGARDYPAWVKTETELRDRLQRLINAPSRDDIALLKNTSEALSFVAYGLTWQPGDNIVTSNEEFPSNRLVWESLSSQGVALRQADLHAGPTPEDALLALIDERTRLLTVSSVQYASGLRLDLQRLGEFCRAHGILFCVDAIQSLGALVLDVQAIQADFVMADGHKWLLGPEGLALFYCREELRDQLTLHEYGWHMVRDIGIYERKDWQIAASARRFECGSPNLLGAYALNASLSLLQEIGMQHVEAMVLARARYLIEAIRQHAELVLITSGQPGRYAGIVTFRHQRVDNATLFRHLTGQGVVCAMRGGGIRFSPHFYLAESQLDQALAVATSL